MELSTQTHFSQGWSKALLEKIKDSGFDTIRDSLGWSVIEQKRGVYDFSHKSVAWVQEAIDAGLNVVLVFNDTNALYDNGGTVYSAKGLSAFADYVVAVLREFPEIRTIEIGNEFNGDNFVSGKVLAASKDARDDYYDQIVDAIDEALTEAGLSVELLGGATHSIPVGYFDKLEDLGTIDMLDGVTIHPYSTPAEQLADQLAVLRSVIGEDTPIHATEFGSKFDSLDDAPAYLAKMVSVMAAEGVASANWYAFASQKWFPNMELWDTKGKELTPAGETYALFEELLANDAKVAQIDIDAYTYFYKFGDNAAVLWGEARDITLGNGVTAFDLSGKKIADLSTISPDIPVILFSDTPITADSVAFAAQRLLADSYHDFDVTNDPGSLAGFEGPWSYFAENGHGQVRALSTNGGDVGGGQLWTPYLDADGLRPLRVNATAINPVDFSGKGRDHADWAVVERYTVASDGLIDITGHWDVKDTTKNGVLLTIEQNDKAIFSAPIYDVSNGHVFDLSLAGIEVQAGDTIDFVIAANGNSYHDLTSRRIQIFQSEDEETPPVETPPVETPPVETPPVEAPPAEEPSVPAKDEIPSDEDYDYTLDLSQEDTQQAVGTKGDDLIVGAEQEGRQVLFGRSGDDFLMGGSSDDKLKGGKGNDELFGDDGNDRLYGGAGDDVLNGGRGDDELTGGRGNDVFVFEEDFGHDQIVDFSDGDIIDLSGIAGIDGMEDLSILYAKKQTIITIDDATIVITGSARTELEADDFLF